MTPQQLATLKTYIDGQPDLSSQPMNGDGDFVIADKLNTQVAAPDFFVWLPSISTNEIMGNGFLWSRVKTMSLDETRVWDFMMRLGVIDPSKSNVRDGINVAFQGAPDNAMRQAIFAHCQKLATRGQKVFASGAGTTTTNIGTGPGTMTVESVAPSDVQQARALP